MGSLYLKIDPDLHRRGKAQAVLQGVNWYRYVEDAIREKVERDEAAGPPIRVVEG